MFDRKTSLLKVMVVDDMPVFLAYMKEVIPWHDHGFELVCEAKDGREALASALACKPVIVLTDINMPYLDGFEFVQSLKQLLPSCSCSRR